MKKFLALFLTSFILCGAVACSSGDTTNKSIIESTKATVTTENIQETVAPAEITGATPSAKKAMEKLEKQGHIGVAYVMKDGKVLATYAKGMLEKDKPITIDTPMPIGSVSKQFCAAAILLLQEQGKLSTDDTLDKYFPDYKPGKKISLKHMLSMRSGIPSYTDNPEECENILSEDKTREENIASIKNFIFSKELDFQPDENFYYSNSNYFLLSDIVEQVSGEKYIDFLRNSFFKPLGMTNTGAICELSSSPDWAQENIYKKDEFPIAWETVKGDGDLISNGADMMLWMNGLCNGKVISPESYNAMTTNYSDVNNYGYGMGVNLLDGVGHSGNIFAYTSTEYINQHKDMFLFMASNTGESGCDYGMFSNLILDLL